MMVDMNNLVRLNSSNILLYIDARDNFKLDNFN